MGSVPSAPQLKDTEVEGGKDITFRWESNVGAYSKWKKGETTLENGDRIRITQSRDYKQFSLVIKNARQEDEGQYTLELWNRKGTVSGSAKVKVLEYDSVWRTIDWGKEEKKVKKLLQEFKPSNPEIKQLRFLLHGPVGAGKSSLINSINSVFQGRINVNALVEAGTDKSFTRTYKTYKIKDDQGRELPFVFNDIMGLENQKGGVLPEDIICAFKGHVSEGYKFKEDTPFSDEFRDYKDNPSLNDKVHCLVSVIPGHTFHLLDDTAVIIKKMRDIRRAASNLGIPQVVFMTHVDMCCPLVKEDLKHVYSSKKIKQAMQQCSNNLGVPMNCIFPIKNYHEATDMDVNINCLILNSLKNIVHFANDYVEDI